MLDDVALGSLARRFPWLDQEPGLAESLRAHGQQVRLAAGHNICFEGDRCSHLALVVDGSARVFKLAASGREITLYRVEAGECCILTASCMLSRRPFPANAVVDADITAVVVAEDHVVDWARRHDGLRQLLWGLIAERLGDVIGLIEEVAFRRMDERLAEFLVSHAPVIDITHQQVADELGTSREVVSRLLKDFESRDWLTLGRGRIEILDGAALAALLR